MGPGRWELVSQICQSALDRAPGERHAFLDEACGSDVSLRQEVDSLLRHETSGDSFLEAPAIARASHFFKTQNIHPFRIAVIGVALLGATIAAATARLIWQHGTNEQRLGWAVGWNSTVIDRVEPNGPAAGKLQRGDRLIAIDGDQRVAMGATWKTSRLVAGQTYVMDLERQGERVRTVLRAEERRNAQGRMTLLARVFVGLIWFSFAVFIGWARPALGTARLFALLGVSVGIELMRSAMFAVFPRLDESTRMLYGVLFLNSSWLPAFAYHGVYRFPPGIRPARLWTGLLISGYLASLALTAVQGLGGVRYFAGTDAAYRLFQQIGLPKPWGNGVFVVITIVMTMLALIVAVRNYVTVGTPDERRRIRWVAVAFGVAAIGGAFNAWNTSSVPSNAIADLVTVGVPATFAYAIVRHRVFDISIVVRIGLQYVLAKNALRIILGLPLVLLAWLVVANPNATIRQIALENPWYLVLAVAAGATLAARARVTRAIDRRFFREAYDREQLLQTILDDLHDANAEESGSQIRERLERAIHPTFLEFWFSDGRTLVSPMPSPSDELTIDRRPFELPLALVQRLEREDSPVTASSLDFASELALMHERFRHGDISVVIPMVARDGRLRGVMILGPKRSEEPYTRADLGMLQRIARQIATVKERGELLTQVHEDQRIRGDVLGHLRSSGVSLLKECPLCGTCYDADQQFCERDGAVVTLSLPVERTIDGRYRLDRLIGRGGMGAVYDATDLRLRRRVAVKLMLGRHFGRADALRRFDREARAVARLSHPNIIAVFDYGTLAAQGAFLVMERVEGDTLRTALAQSTRALTERLQWVVQIIDGVAAAHAHGVIHRDLKPENILLAERGPGSFQVKVLDFGLARLQASALDDTASISEPGQIMGTLAYMAPEQLRGKEVDQRADIFSTGLIIFEIVTLRRLFSGGPLHRHEEIQAVSDASVVADAQLRAILSRCLSEEPGDRYARLEQLRADLLLLL